MRHIRFLTAIGAACGCQAGAAQSVASDSAAAPYRVECAAASAESACRVDLATYIGWRVYQAQCATCHAGDALGSSFAPDLTLRMSAMTQRRFFAALDQGYFGSQSTMPPRGRDPNVAPYYDELWSYLSARVTGALPAGPVERLPEDEGGSGE
jgi:mono/diheme cytochrome c family protein